MKLENVAAEGLVDLGQAKSITIDKDNTTIIDGAGDDAKLQARIKQIEPNEETTSDYDREKLKSVWPSWLAVLR